MDEVLVARYTEILAGTDPSFLDPTEARKIGLSTPFLANGPKDPSAPRIMVIGREYGAKGWKVELEDSGVRAYVTAALARHRAMFDKFLAKKNNSRGATFPNFLRDLAKGIGTADGLIYSNLLCIDAGGKAPTKSEYFPEIKDLSKRLLDFQIDHFKPDVIIFANGSTARGVRVDFFPTKGERNVCVGRRDWEEAGIPNRQLWEFELLGKFLCYRIQHPSAQSKAAASARRHLVEVLAKTLPHTRMVPATVAGAKASVITVCEP